MAVLFDESGQPVAVPDDQLDAAYRTGRFQLPEAARYNVRAPDGRVISVTREELNPLLAQPDSGFQLAGEAETIQQVRRDEAAASPIQAGVEGALRGATLGGSDVLAEGIASAGANNPLDIARRGQETREGLALRQELNPMASGVGEAAGAVGSMLIGGGMAPAGMLMRAAEAAGARATTGALARGAGRVAARARGLAVEGLIEGGVTGAAQTVSEAHLQDRELTAEALLMGTGLGAVLGGALGAPAGAAFGAAESAAGALGRAVARPGSALARGADRAANAMERAGGQLQGITERVLDQGERLGGDAVEAARRLYQRAAGPDAADIAPGVAELFARGSSLATGADASDVRRFADLTPQGQRVRQLVAQQDDVLERAAREGRAVLDQSERFARDVMDESIGTFKRTNVARMIEGGDVTSAARQADEVLSFIGAQADEMMTDAAAWGERAAVSRIRQDVDILKRRLTSANTQEDLADVFMELDAFKRRMGRNARPGRTVQSSQDASATARIRDWYERTRQHLEADDLYGGAAEAQREVNAAWTRYLGSAQTYRDNFLQRVGQDAFNPVFTHDPARLESFLRNTGRVRNDIAAEALQSHVASQKQLVEAIGKHFELSPKAQSALASGRESGEKLGAWLTSTREQVGTINQFRAMSEAASAQPNMGLQVAGGAIGAAAGSLVGAPTLGAAAGAAVAQFIARPDAAIKTLTALERMNGAMGGRIAAAARTFMARGRELASKAGPAIRKGARVAAERGEAALVRGAQATRALGEGAEGRLIRGGQALERRGVATAAVGAEVSRAGRRAATALALSSYEERADKVRAAQADAQGTIDRLSAITAPIASAAPMTSAAVGMRAQKAIGLLASKLPTPARDPIQPFLKRGGRVSDQEKTRWLRYARAVEDPMSVIEDLEGGDLNREGVEVLREIFPEIFRRVQTEVAQQVAASEEQIPYLQRLQLGILFDVATDPSLEPNMITALQASWSQAAMQEQAQPQSAPQSPAAAPDMASAAPLASAMDAFEQRQAAGG